jgi:hypothetical protein
VSYLPPEQEPDDAASASRAGGTTDAGGTSWADGAADAGATYAGTADAGGAAGAGSATDAGDAADAGQRRRRRLWTAGIAAVAALVVLGLCAGFLGVISAVRGLRADAADARESHEQRETSCLELEQRLNRLVPPGATRTAQARATAIRDENAAVRIYVEQDRSEREQDAWRQLLEARTAYAEALMQQAKTRTPAFFAPPQADDGSAVTDQLAQWSPPACAGAIRRLAAPDW